MSRIIEISDETWEKIKNQVEEDQTSVVEEVSSYDDMIDQKWFFRTVTNFLVGKIKKRVGGFFLLEGASWVASTSRFSEFINNGPSSSSEIEPVGKCLINISTIVDAFPWKHSLPNKVI
jgi:hypothetical protein